MIVTILKLSLEGQELSKVSLAAPQRAAPKKILKRMKILLDRRGTVYQHFLI
jgi:hypothetical protein